MKMKIADVLGISDAKLICGNPEEQLGCFSKDTRTINRGDVYIAFCGENFDGNDFFGDAFSKEAKTCILSKLENEEEVKKQYLDKNIILVRDTIEFITELAKKKRETIHVPVIAVTGSVGKTSTKNLIASVLEQKYTVLKTQGNLNTNIGLSLTLLGYQNEECIVLEMGMNTFGEISTLSNIAKPTIAVITNIGTSHIGNLGSRENILKAKLEILEGLTGPILVNNDNDLLHKWGTNNQEREIITFGIAEESDYQATDIHYSKNGSSFYLKNQEYQIPVYGKAFIYNSLVAYAIGKMLDINDEDIRYAYQKQKSEEHRMCKIEACNFLILDDTYNSSYDSLVLALDVLKSFSARKIAVLGDILELGEFSEKIHRDIGELVLNTHVDLLVTVGELSKYINEEAMKLGLNIDSCFHFDKNEEAIDFLKNNIKAKDVVLVKASHAMNFGQIVDELKVWEF